MSFAQGPSPCPCGQRAAGAGLRRPLPAVVVRTTPGRARSARADTQSSSKRSLEAVLEDAGIELSVLGSVRQRHPELARVSVEERVEPLLDYLTRMGLRAGDVQVMLLRCPRLLTYSLQRQVLPVVAFLEGDLGFGRQQVAATLRRFPQLMGYGVKSHLVPHCHYLKSLGVSDEDLPRLVLARPHVLGSSIELVITYLRKWLRISRTNVGRLLWSYPLDYSLPRLVLPDSEEEEEEQEEQQQGDGQAGGPGRDGSSSSGDGGSAAAAAAASAAPASPSPSGQGGGAGSSSSGSSGGGDWGTNPAGQQAGHEQGPKRAPPPLGSAERCTWLPGLNLRGGRSSGGSTPGGGGGSRPEDGNGGAPPPPPAAA